jgi:hypothetical protein
VFLENHPDNKKIDEKIPLNQKNLVEMWKFSPQISKCWNLFSNKLKNNDKICTLLSFVAKMQNFTNKKLNK